MTLLFNVQLTLVGTLFLLGGGVGGLFSQRLGRETNNSHYNDQGNQCVPINGNVTVIHTGGKLFNPSRIRNQFHKVEFALRGEIHKKTLELVRELKQV